MSSEKDGGWGWCVTGSSFMIHFIVCGIGYTCGIFHIYFMRYFESNRLETSCISASLLALTALGGIPGSLLSYKLGYRATVVLGGLLSGIGMFISIFFTELWQIVLTVGVLTGLGFGIALTPSILILESYFFNKRDLACSIAVTGSSLGIFAFPVAAYYLEDQFAWKGMALIFSGLCLHICVGGLTMRPNGTSIKGKHLIKLFETSLLKSSAFVCLLNSNILWCLGLSIIYTYLPDYAQTTGLTLEDGAILIAVTGLSNFISRVTFTIFNQSARLDHVSTFLCTVLLSTILTGLFPEMFKHKAGAIGYAIILGFQCGFTSTFIGHISSNLIGEEYMAYGKGFVSVSMGLGLAIGPPLAGWIYDKTDNFEIAFYLAGASLLLSSIIMMIVDLKRCYYRPTIPDWSDSDSDSTISRSSRPEQETLLITSKMSSV